jgi:hypothetical protein
MKYFEELLGEWYNTMAMIRTLACIIFLIFSLCSCSTNKETTSADHIDCFVTPEGNRSYWCFDHEVSVSLEPEPITLAENSQMEGYFNSKKYLSKRVSR